MLIKSGLVTQMSGSMGGMTGSHNSAGMYLRGRGLVTNPNTAAQQAIRAILSGLVTAWATITQAQRDAWATYATNTPITGKLGDPLTLSGQQMYIRCNTPRIQAGLTRVDNGPTVMAMADLSPVGFGDMGQAGNSSLEVTYDNADDWATTTGGALLVQMSRQLSVTRNFFKGPFRYAAKAVGDTTTPPTSPLEATNPFGDVYAVGNIVVIRCRAVNADGRISPVQMVTSPPIEA